MKIDNVAIVKRNINGYPWFPPFDPHEAYPEYPFNSISNVENHVYEMVRQALWDLELDRVNRGKPEWNPFRSIIAPGSCVVIKPNFALDYNTEHKGRAAIAAVTTDGSVLRPIIDYAYKACGDQGKIIICDTPLQNSVSVQLFNNVVTFNGVSQTVSELKNRGVGISLLDLRSQVREVTARGFWRLRKLEGDPLGYVTFDLGKLSAFEDCPHLERVETNDWENVSKYHSKGRHIYSISKTLLAAETVINVPKLKVHKKTGLTVALKNMFALSNRKDLIPHWRRGVDNNPSMTSKVAELLRTLYSIPATRPIAQYLDRYFLGGKLDGHGNWRGNDTTWRAVLDLNRILMYGDIKGTLHNTVQRNVFVIVDGIIAGERQGPLGPKPKPFGAIIAGNNAVEVDIACSQIMRLDPSKVMLLVHAIERHELPLSNCTLDSLQPKNAILRLSEPFELPRGWEDASIPIDKLDALGDSTSDHHSGEKLIRDELPAYEARIPKGY